MYVIQHCFICRPSDSTVSEDAGIEPRTVATLALTAIRSIHSADLLHCGVFNLFSVCQCLPTFATIPSKDHPRARDGGHEHLISNGERFKPAFAERNDKQTMIDLRGISTNRVY
jgi:hypothetical protein